MSNLIQSDWETLDGQVITGKRAGHPIREVTTHRGRQGAGSSGGVLTAHITYSDGTASEMLVFDPGVYAHSFGRGALPALGQNNE